MATEVKLAPMVDNKTDAGQDWFFCDGCLAYHPPEYRAEYQSTSEYKNFCSFAVAVIRDGDLPVSDTPLESISQAWDIDEKAVTLSSLTDSTCDDDSVPVNVTRKQRALRKELPEDGILASKESGEVLAKKYGVSKMTISRIRRGQRVLV